MNGKLKGVIVALLSVILGLVMGAVIMLVSGHDPVAGYGAMIQGSFGDLSYFGETLRQSTPLILTALAFAVASTAGFFNIGIEGQSLLGWLGAVWCALAFPDLPKFILLPACLIVGALFGAFWAGIAGMLKAFFNTSEVIITIMLNYIALYISNFVIRDIITDGKDATPMIPDAASLRSPGLEQLTDYSRLHYGIIIAVLMCVIVWILMQKTTTGYELRAVGMNPFASQYAGMSTKRNIILAMVISGALAGLGGTMEGLGTFKNIFTQNSLPGLGFNGMAVSLLGGGNPFGIIAAGILFGALKTGGLLMPTEAGVPEELVDIVIALIIFFVGASYLITYLLDKLPAKKNALKEGGE